MPTEHTPDRMIIREMKERDFQTVRELWLESGLNVSLSDEPAELKRMIRQNPGLCLVGVLDSNKMLVAAVLGGFDGRRGWVYHLAVDSDHLKRGFGSQLLRELISRFRARKVVKLKLDVQSNNKTVVDFYKKLQWILREDLISMSLDLREK